MLYYNHFIIVYIVYIQYIQYITQNKTDGFLCRRSCYIIISLISFGTLPCCAAIAGLFIVFKNQCGRLTCAPCPVAKAPQNLRKVANHACTLFCLFAIHIMWQAPFYARCTLGVNSINVVFKIYPTAVYAIHISACPIVKIAPPNFLRTFRIFKHIIQQRLE